MTHTQAATVYYSDGGQKRIKETVRLAIRRARVLRVNHLLIFTADGLGPKAAVDHLKGEQCPKVIAVTFPAGQVFLNENREPFTTKLASDTNRKELRSLGIEVVQGTMPFQEIIVPGTSNPKTDAIHMTLGLLSPGTHLCVQAILMATDAGAVEQGEEVVAMCADTAIVATGALSHWLFHPTRGLEIREVICKPRKHRQPYDESPSSVE